VLRAGALAAACTLATVGIGDVHATGQMARAAVTSQIVVNLVFLGTVVAIIGSMTRERAAKRQRQGAVAGRDGADDGG
jgi:voltage-gated potassium channel